MTADEFQTIAIALLRSPAGWQAAIASRLGVRDRTVRRWLENNLTPAWVDERLAEMIGARDISPWPRDEWMIGDAVTADGRRREYIMHMAAPRFVARIVMCDDTDPVPDEEPADIVSGTVYVIDADDYGQTVLCEIDWIDEVAIGQKTQLLEAAADAITEQNRRETS